MARPSDDLKTIALRLGLQGPHKTLATARQVRLLFNNEYIVKTTKAVYVWEHSYFPQLYIPLSEIIQAFSHSSWQIEFGEEYTSPDNDMILAKQMILHVNDRSITKTIAFSPKLTGAAAPLGDLVKIDFGSVDQWFEEDTPIFVHPKDPFKRIDILTSTRNIKVRIAGQLVAETDFSMHLYETGLPCRYYLPRTAIDAKILRPSTTKTRCPYKGEAEYYSIEIGGQLSPDIVWYYNQPCLEVAKIEGLCCFYNEKVQIEVSD